MLLQDVLRQTDIISTEGRLDIPIAGVAFDSRQVKLGYLFVAVKGVQNDGHVFVMQAIENGAKAILVELDPPSLEPGITYVKVKNSAQALGQIASNYYGRPSELLTLVGVTGTNGKTTVATLLYRLYISIGYKTGLLSTIENRINQQSLPATHTTPDPLQLHRLLRQMVEEGCTHCFMEVSSHALAQDRVAGLCFAGGIWMNISHDHLDYHRTFDHYIRSKKKFFDELPAEAFALANADDRRNGVMLQNTKAHKKTFSLQRTADFRAKLISATLEGLEMEVDHRTVWLKLLGDFNAYNALAVYAATVLLGEEPETVLKILSSLAGVPGRIELVDTGKPFFAVVDYSHTPDALENILQALTRIKRKENDIISVVGCGGNRDPLKRPIMAAIACKYSQQVIFTSDNPRYEDPMEIIREMQKGLRTADKKHTLVIVDRLQAIQRACSIAKPNDIVLVAGKGHETYQEIKGQRHPFDDREVLQKILHAGESSLTSSMPSSI